MHINQALIFATFAIIELALLLLVFFKYATEKQQWEQSIKEARADAIKRSKSAIRGHVSQEVLPILDGFPYSLSDCKFSGQPLDYIVFEGMSEFRDGNKEKEVSIVFADVKYGKAHKTPVQREIVDAIENGRVRFETWKIDENNKLTIK